MSEFRIAAIMRSGMYSPNHIGNDAAILNMVAEQLRKRGCTVNIYSEEKLASGMVKEDIIVNMCRERRSIEQLQKLEDQGALVINSGYGIENCTRERLVRILLGNNLPYAESIVVNTNEMVIPRLKDLGDSRFWIKRGDCHDQHKEDVSYVRNKEEAQEVVQEFFLRGITKAVINRHIEGEMIKFYGILGSDYFHCFYPFDPHTDTAPTHSLKIDKKVLASTCARVAETVGVVVYGGDCVVTPDGDLRIINFVDWPSFAPCRIEAAPYIAKRILALIKQRSK